MTASDDGSNDIIRYEPEQGSGIDIIPIWTVADFVDWLEVQTGGRDNFRFL
jgi:hypothetical protein